MKADQVITITREESKLLGQLVQKHLDSMVRRRELTKSHGLTRTALKWDAEVSKARALLANFIR